MDAAALTTNLRRLRMSRGKSQGELAAAAGLSRVGYRNVETGEVTPRIDTLLRVAQALSVRLEDLLAPARSLDRVRFRSARKMTSREELIATVAQDLEVFRELLSHVPEERKPFTLARLRARFSQMRAGASRAVLAAAEVRKALRLDGAAPVRDLVGLLEARGILVMTVEVASEGFWGLSVHEDDGGPAVVVNAWERVPVERRIFGVARELGHLLLHAAGYDARRTEENATEETEASLFAAHLLVPDNGLAEACAEASGLPFLPRVLKLKRHFGASWQTVIARMTEGKPRAQRTRAYAAFRDEWERRAGKRPGPEEPPPGFYRCEPAERAGDEPARLDDADFLPARRFRLARLAVERGAISIERAAELLGAAPDLLRSGWR
jgi:Zn-dependent peptidase ImmA (M78 family)/transcriptional regulator with XRE-family HTH domain